MADPVAPQGPPMDSGPVVFDRPSALRTRSAVTFVERRNRSAPSSSDEPRGKNIVGAYAQVTTAITAASGSTLGSGVITLCSRSGAALTADGATGLTCYNAGGAIAVSTFLAVYWVDGDWSTCVGPCP